MTRFADKNKAILLRKKGMSYSQIKEELKVGKSTLSYWLREMPLTKERIKELKDKNEIRIEKFRNTMKKKKEKRLNIILKKQKKVIFPINKRELFIAGLFLYWGEGTKKHSATLGMTNTDPSIMIFFIKWITECFHIPRKKIKVQMHLYKDMNIQEEIVFWSKKIKIPEKQFTKPYIKSSYNKDIKHNKGGFGHGTCNIRIGNARLTEKIMMSLKAISE
ncbi:MAG: hypothetical protein COU31_01820 [Candidatus Magasanikbacteria bacterium CG10_big_fil_rev_8_21_14_0_10_40_10]|uniref:Uncharacterized protein n=1 Tax=Candidatus Magasanikbacteria bacterium CG10_big_fil_rev_8_21_14_0_10_40_10 TaxID=1974648 RepID=A0A2M6W4G6_9BACT|nr:MAG: hypothetical protein COU31_01820 [Candidatus Magasanikbacteria bacterium CG10_big_fil_rev_8_21_14_0_10_40_10]